MKGHPLSYAVAALALELKAAREIQLFPAGEFRAADGRPKGLKAWTIDATIAAGVIAAAQSRSNAFVVDYEHQTLHADKNGQPAPAAAWFKTLEWREGKGLFATDVEWTGRAKEMIEAGEYRYISPVFAYDPKTGAVRAIHHVAVTNVPALDGMDELMLRAAAKFDFPQEQAMLKQILIALGLAESSTETDALSAVSALKAKADKVPTLETEVAALKMKTTPDPAQYAPVAAMKILQDQVAALTTAAATREVDEVVTAALSDGKLLPAQEAWARELGIKDLAALKQYVETAPALPALRGTQTSGRQPQQPAAGGDVVATAKTEFEGSAQLRGEFIDLASYTAYRKAESQGRVKILGGRDAH